MFKTHSFSKMQKILKKHQPALNLVFIFFQEGNIGHIILSFSKKMGLIACKTPPQLQSLFWLGNTSFIFLPCYLCVSQFLLAFFRRGRASNFGHQTKDPSKMMLFFRLKNFLKRFEINTSHIHVVTLHICSIVNVHYLLPYQQQQH